MKRIVLISIGILIAVGLVVVFLLPLLFSGGIPYIIVDSDSKPDLPPGSNMRVVTGDATYTLRLLYSDGSQIEFAETTRIKELPLGSITAGAKELSAVEVESFIDIALPQKVDDVGEYVATASKVRFMLSGNTIATETKSGQYTLSDLDQGVTLYKFSVPASKLQASVPDGKHALSIEADDALNFRVIAADGSVTDRSLEIEARPTFAYSKDAGLLSDFTVVSRTASVGAVLEKIPSWGYTYQTGQCPVGTNKFIECQVLKETIVGYTTDVVIKATNFKPFSDIKFDYSKTGPATTDPGSVKVKTSLIPYTIVTKKTDLYGNAEDRYYWNSLYEPECGSYYALFKVSDDSSEARGKVGCNSYYYSIRNCACAEATWQLSSQKQYEDDFLAGKVG